MRLAVERRESGNAAIVLDARDGENGNVAVRKHRLPFRCRKSRIALRIRSDEVFPGAKTFLRRADVAQGIWTDDIDVIAAPIVVGHDESFAVGENLRIQQAAGFEMV